MSSHSFLSFYRSGLSEVLLQPDGRCRIDVCSYYRQIAMSKAVSSMSLGKQARQQLSLSLFFYGNTAPPTLPFDPSFSFCVASDIGCLSR